MAALHIINHPAALTECLTVARESDCILLIEEGVWALEQHCSRKLIALDEDLNSRNPVVSVAPEVVDYAGFVELATQHQPIVSWR